MMKVKIIKDSVYPLYVFTKRKTGELLEIPKELKKQHEENLKRLEDTNNQIGELYDNRKQ